MFASLITKTITIMKNIKFIKAMRLSLLVAMLSLGFTTMSCSPDDELITEEVDNVDEVYNRYVFMIVGQNSYSGVVEPEYNLVFAEFNTETDDFIKVKFVYKDWDRLKSEAYNYSRKMGVIGTHVFLEYNYSGCNKPLIINPDYGTPETQLNLHLSQDIIDYLIERDSNPLYTSFPLEQVIEKIESLRDCLIINN
jgi:hypothetical protein